MKPNRKLYVLSKTQKEFASKNLGLVFKFLRENDLDENEFFDEVIFRYMRSVKRYNTEKSLRKYRFSTIAWRGMSAAKAAYFLKQARRNEKVSFISLDANVPGCEDLKLSDVISDSRDFMEEIEMRETLRSIFGSVSNLERTILVMKCYGYSESEIARKFETSPSRIEDIISDLRVRLSPSFVELQIA